MKTSILTRMSAMAMSTVFALAATAGVAFLMIQGGEEALTQIAAASAAARQRADSAAPELSQLKSNNAAAREVM